MKPLSLFLKSTLPGVGLAALVLLVGLKPVEAERSPCAGLVNPDHKRACFEREFESADRRLQRVTEAIYEDLGESQRQELQADALRWAGYRDELCGDPDGLETDGQTALFACRLELTNERMDYVRRAFSGEGVRSGRAGVYDDGFGGQLTLRSLEGETLQFAIDVVRGPTAHIGQISGEIQIQNGEARFESEANCGDRCCTLEFRFFERAVEVTEGECSEYHGLRAYFDGRYRKIR